MGSISQPLLEQSASDLTHGAGRWMVVIYNNETNSVDEVIDILMQATGCDLEEASIETWEAHHYGQAPVPFDSRTECEGIAEMIAAIGVRTAVRKEWEE
ncbi:MAG TPA: ATP-dependent Clp protease adaptor ClpS [Fimbriimonadaceae bacterium]|nr:ATP-dependent Clp protease adaptor ClpS [Fimbriimonadaceae bacterium]HRJ32155.1 ATP-dependent Clp protease adaptor ClpS [Fimbriimonadaceae bacterium]